MIAIRRRRIYVEGFPKELNVDVTAQKKSDANVTITDGIASKLIYANGNQGNRCFWNTVTNGKSWIFDVTKYSGRRATITYWNKSNTRTYIFVPNTNLIPSSDPGATEYPNLYIPPIGAKAKSTTTYTPQTVTVTIPQAITAAGNPCDKIHLIVSGYYVSADSASNIIPTVVIS